MFLIRLLLVFILANVAHAQGLLSLAGSAPETGIVGLIEEDNFDRASLGSEWEVSAGFSLSVVTNDLLRVTGATDLTDWAYMTPVESCSENWSIQWNVFCSTLTASTPGVGVGTYAIRNNRSYFGLFGMDTGSDGKKAQIWEWDGSNWSKRSTGSAITTLSAGDLINCGFHRNPTNLTFSATNTANGQVSTTTMNFNFASIGARTVGGPQKLGVWAYNGEYHIDDLTWTNTAPYPTDIVVVGDSITEGLTAGTVTDRYSTQLRDANPGTTIRTYAGSSGTLTNILNGFDELIRYRPRKVMLMIGGNDYQFGYTESVIKSNYWLLTTNLMNEGIQVIHSLPTPRNTDLSVHKNFIATNWPTLHIDNWTNMLGTGTSLHPDFDSGDGVHPDLDGHNQIYSNIVDSALLP